MAPHEPVTQIRITSYEIVTSPSRHVIYTIHLQGPVRSWTVTKRYSELESLHHKLSLLSQTPVQLPAKTLFSSLPSQAFNTEFINDRRLGLERYLQAILHHPNAIWRRSKEWCDFFSIPDRKNGGARAVSGTWLKSDSSNDAESWMEEYSSVMDALRKIREYVIERDKAYSRGDSNVANTAAITGKKVLVSLSSRIQTLEDVLLRMNNHRNNKSNFVDDTSDSPPTYDNSRSTFNDISSSPTLASGEWNRRNDMIATLRDERDALTRVLALPPKNTLDRSALLGASSSRSSPSNTHNAINDSSQPIAPYVSLSKTTRQFGSLIIPQETHVTRPLTNEGVLQYHQQIMATQDQEVDALLAIVRRQKEIGNSISDELDVHNQMLNELGQDVDRTRVGVKKVNKQLDKVRGKR